MAEERSDLISTKGNITGYLEDIRRSFSKRIKELIELLEGSKFLENEFHLSDISNEQFRDNQQRYKKFCTAYITYLFERFIPDDDDLEVLLVAYNLHPKYKHIHSLTKRRAAFARDGYEVKHGKQWGEKDSAKSRGILSEEARIIEAFVDALAKLAFKNNNILGLGMEVLAKMENADKLSGNLEEPPPTQPILVQPLETTPTEDEDSTSQPIAEPNSNGNPDASPVENIVDSYNVIDDHSVTTMQHVTNSTVIININSTTTPQSGVSEPSELILVPDKLPADIQLLPSGETEPEPPVSDPEPELLPEEPVTFRKWVRAFLRSIVGVYSELPDDGHKALWTKLPAKTRWITITAISALIAVAIIVGTWFVWVKFNPSLDAAGPEQQENSVNLTKESNKITDEDMASLIADAKATIAIYDEAGEYDIERMRELIRIRILTNPIFGDAVARGLLEADAIMSGNIVSNNLRMEEFITATDAAMETPDRYEEGMRKWLVKTSGLISTTDGYKGYADQLCRILDFLECGEVDNLRTTNYWSVEPDDNGIYTRAAEVSENIVRPVLIMRYTGAGGQIVLIFGFAIDDGAFCISNPQRWGIDSFVE